MLDAYADRGPPATARAWFARHAPGRVDELLHELVRRYVALGKFRSATAVLYDLVAHETDFDLRCRDLEQLFSAQRNYEPLDHVVSDAEALVTAVAHSTSPQCRRDADAELGLLAWEWQREHPWREADLAVADALWRLDLAVVTTAERRAAALRDRAIIRWQIAREARTVDARVWTAAAEAFSAAAATSPDDRELSAASAAARVNAIVIRSRQ